MHLLHLDPDFIDERMKVRDFLLSCEWVDDYSKGANDGGA